MIIISNIVHNNGCYLCKILQFSIWMMWNPFLMISAKVAPLHLHALEWGTMDGGGWRGIKLENPTTAIIPHINIQHPRAGNEIQCKHLLTNFLYEMKKLYNDNDNHSWMERTNDGFWDGSGYFRNVPFLKPVYCSEKW